MNIISRKMTWSGPEFTVDLGDGPVTGVVRACFTRADHVHISTETGNGIPPIVVRGKPYTAYAHLFAAEGWDVRESDGVDASHFDQTNCRTRAAAPTIRTAIQNALRQVAVMLADDDTLRSAEINHLTHELERADKEFAEAEVTYLAARDKRNRLAATLESAEAEAVPDRVVFRCAECGMTATAATDPNEWAYGHDCEV